MGEAFLDRHFRVKDGILDPKREVRPSMGLRGALSARRLLVRGFDANSLSGVSSSKSYAEEKCGPPTRLRIHSGSGIFGKASSVKLWLTHEEAYTRTGPAQDMARAPITFADTFFLNAIDHLVVFVLI